MKYIFGPVPSRRLGQSLGIDPIPLKTCNWNCVYCQLGRTRPLTNERKDYFPPEEIAAEVREALQAHKPGEIDWVTFVGSGETLLYSSMGRLLRQVKGITDLPLAVITNGSLLFLPEVRRDLSTADAVLPTLDAGTAELYRQINRPHPEATFERLVEGLVAFREEYRGRLWVEVMLVRGLNDTPQALADIARILQEVSPDAVHINLPTRPPVETWVEPPQAEGLARAMAILGSIAEVVHPAEGSFDLSGYDDPVDAILAIITRHPMRQEDLERALSRWSPGQVSRVLANLEASGRAQVVERYGVRFWSAAPSYYPDEGQSLRTYPGHYRHNEKGQQG
ncbi:MAG: radical SAM protein [Anaerolineales bacterium]|jgi:wyosine [tRNA(Phe)-imidazoG37] synthetase (radical SAM superfamily)